MSPAQTKALVRAWKDMGAPGGGAVLAMGPQGFELAKAVTATLTPDRLVLIHHGPPPARARFETAPDLQDIPHDPAEAFDMVAAGGHLETGDLSEVRDRMLRIASLVRPGGVLAAAIQTFASLDADHGHNALLFPHLAHRGYLGPAVQARAPLPASAWCALLQSVGFEVPEFGGQHAQSLSDEFRTRHEARIAAFDAEELGRGSLCLIARKTGAPS